MADKTLQRFIELEVEKDAADVEKAKACAAGGNKEVKHPTRVVEVVTMDGSSLPSSIGGEDGSSLKGAEGKLTPGAIAGIVVGVLAVLGVVAVAAAPMLGIQLPFQLPALPF